MRVTVTNSNFTTFDVKRAMALTVAEEIEELKKKITLLGNMHLYECAVDNVLSMACRWRQEGIQRKLAMDHSPKQRHNLSTEAGEQDTESQALKEDEGECISQWILEVTLLQADDDVISEVFHQHNQQPPAELRGVSGEVRPHPTASAPPNTAHRWQYASLTRQCVRF